MNFNSRMKVNFDGGDLTSDAGLLLYKKFDHQVDLSKTVKQILVVDDPVHGIILKSRWFCRKFIRMWRDIIPATMPMI
ncbi:hypothetical protein [Brevibacillus reuszeri]